MISISKNYLPWVKDHQFLEQWIAFMPVSDQRWCKWMHDEQCPWCSELKTRKLQLLAYETHRAKCHSWATPAHPFSTNSFLYSSGFLWPWIEQDGSGPYLLKRQAFSFLVKNYLFAKFKNSRPFHILLSGLYTAYIWHLVPQDTHSNFFLWSLRGRDRLLSVSPLSLLTQASSESECEGHRGVGFLFPFSTLHAARLSILKDCKLP